MINLNLTIKNPWNDRWNMIKSKHRMLTGHWAWQSATYQTGLILAIEFEAKFRTDHQGVRLFLGLFGWAAEFSVYDRRHWHKKRKKG